MSLRSPVNRRQAGALLAALSAAFAAGCGGGGDDGGSMMAGGSGAGGGATAGSGGAAGATSYAAGPITGFGSVIVNGVRYDDSAAEVLDAEDRPHGREQLKLGMMVEIDGTAMDRARGTGRALRIRFGPALLGPASGIDAAAGTFQVLGQTVVVTDTTVFDEDIAGGLDDLAGHVVEVHGELDAAAGQYRATRIELEDDAAYYRLRGTVADLDTTAKTFTIGGEPISYAGVAVVPPWLADGVMVGVRLQTAQADGRWVALGFGPGMRAPEDRPEAHLRGIVTAFTSSADFEVNGLRVDATGARFPDGTEGLVLGARVELAGAVSGGVLVATVVELDDRHQRERHRFELHGVISGLDTGAQTFQLRGITVGYGGSVTWAHGSQADLADGRRVEVRGQPSADRTRLEATAITFE
jgi:hypothetical protein